MATLIQSKVGGFGTSTSGSFTSSGATFSATTTLGSLIVFVIWGTATGSSMGELSFEMLVGGSPFYPYAAAVADSTVAGYSPQYAAAIYCIHNYAPILSSTPITMYASAYNSATMAAEFSMYEISISGGGMAQQVKLNNSGTPPATATPNPGTMNTTNTDVILSAFCGSAGCSVGTGYTAGISASHFSGGIAGQAQYLLNEPAGAISTAFSGTASKFAAVALSFSTGPVFADPAGVTAASGENNPTATDTSIVYPAGVSARCAVNNPSVKQPGVGLGSFEVRLSDDSWGCDSGGNLVGRFTTQSFAIPRIQRNQVIYIKQQDGRNNLLSSEIWVNGGGSTIYQSNVWVNAVDWTLVKMLNADYNLAVVNSKLMVPGDSTYQVVAPLLASAPNIPYSATIDINGPSGNWITLSITPTVGAASYQSYQLTGQWQRITIPWTASGSAGINQTLGMTFTIAPGVSNTYGVPLSYTFPSGGITIYGSRASLEQAAAETIYCKTLSNGSTAPVMVGSIPTIPTLGPYGALSRYATSIRCGYPFPPQSPTGFVDASDPSNPIINLNLPNVAQDVWGVEIRAADNLTVLYHAALTDASYAPTYTVENNTATSLAFYLYTFNLLGEYSAQYALTITGLSP